MKRTRDSPSASLVTRKHSKPANMPISGNHPKLQHIEGKTKRREECQNLIAAIVDSLAARIPSSQAVRCGHRVSRPQLDRGKSNILTAGQYHQHVCNFLTSIFAIA
jgi:hypothetical protein